MFTRKTLIAFSVACYVLVLGAIVLLVLNAVYNGNALGVMISGILDIVTFGICGTLFTLSALKKEGKKGL